MPTIPNVKDKDENQHIQVAVRLRPINSLERKQGSYSVADASVEKREVTVKERLGVNPTTKTFSFDHVFTQDSKQRDIYKTIVSPIITEVLSGYNCTIFAYGQTGTGKTFTMEGERTDDPSLTWEEDPLIGIIPRALANIFDTLQSQECEYSVRVSFLELYNEELFDLLGSSLDTLRLKIYDDITRKGSVIIHGLEEIVVNTKNEVYEILERGASRRQTAATLINAHSSRSHSVFTVTIHTKENTMEGEELLKTGKLHLVDLAGSENIGRSGAVEKRAREAGNINQSLLTLGRVITALVEHAPHIPYRESKLTRLLKDSLGGRTKTSIIATISPASINLEETISTLDYAHRAKNITNRPEVNQKLAKKALIKEYNDEIDKLRRDLHAAREKNGFFIAEENYNTMQMKLITQDDTIEDLTARIDAVSEELTKVQDLFAETKQELEETIEKLTVTKDTLVQTKSTLRDTKVKLRSTEQDRNEQQYLVTEHVKAETELYDKATSLLHTVDELTSDVGGLHNKVHRMKTVEDHNKQTTESYEESFVKNISQMMESMHSYTSEQQDIHSRHTQHIANNVQRNKDTMDSLTTQMRNLQACLKQHLEALTQHQKSHAEQQTCWVQNVQASATIMKDDELTQLGRIQTTITDQFAGMLNQIGTIGTSLEHVSTSLHSQREEQDQYLNGWSRRFSSGLLELEEIVVTHTASQDKKINTMQADLASLKESYNTRQQVIQDKLAEIVQLQEDNDVVVSEMGTVTVSQTDEIKSQVAAMGNRVGEKRKLLDTEKQSSLDEYFSIQQKHCKYSQKQVKEVKESSQVVHTTGMKISEQVEQYTKETKHIVTNYAQGFDASCTQHITAINTELNTHYSHAENLQSAGQAECDRLVCTLDNHTAAVETDVNLHKETVDGQLAGMTTFARAQLTQLTEQKGEMEHYSKQDLTECAPTGTTPQRREFEIKRNLKRTSDHGMLLDRFHKENVNAVEDEIDSDIEEDTASQVVVVETANEEELDDKSDVVSLRSSTSSVSTSGVSTSGVSSISATSQISECKENDRRGRPLGSKKSKKTNFVNVTPRSRTRLPLKQTNAQTQKTDS